MENLDTISPELRKLYMTGMLDMLWMCPDDPRFCYRVHLPRYYIDEDHETAAPYRLLVLVHATGCYIDEFLRDAAPWADEHHAALLAPVFPGGIQGRDEFNQFKYVRDRAVLYDEVLLSMVRDMGERYPGVETGRFFMFGQSAGGQFVNRFLFLHPDRLAGASIGAPGFPTYIDRGRDFPDGIRDFEKTLGLPFNLDEIGKVPVQIVIGEKDTDPVDSTDPGSSRMARNGALCENFNRNGVKTTFTVIPGLKHVDGNRKRIKACTDFFTQFL